VTRMADMDDSERQKWRDIILGQTSDILNNRASLQEAIRKLHSLKGTVQSTSAPSSKPRPLQSISESKEADQDRAAEDDPVDPNEEIKVCLSIIHNLLDKNEAVLAKLLGVPLLLDLIAESVDRDNEICLDSCTILHDATQNNPMMQNHLYSHHGVRMVLNSLQKCSKHNYAIRAKLWALIHVMSRDHNPNFNVFLTHSGHHQINRVLRIEQNNITPDLLREISRVSRLINYMLATWSDGNETVFATLNILHSVNWTIYSLHHYVIRLVSPTANVQAVDPQAARSRSRTAQQILDILMELVGGIRLFMKRDDRCKRFVIKKHRDIADKLEQFQSDLKGYCMKHRPEMKMDCKGQYRYRYYVHYNDDDGHHGDQEAESKDANGDGDGDGNGDGDGDPMYLAMKDIFNAISSVLRLKVEFIERRKRERAAKTQSEGDGSKQPQSALSIGAVVTVPNDKGDDEIGIVPQKCVSALRTATNK